METDFVLKQTLHAKAVFHLMVTNVPTATAKATMKEIKEMITSPDTMYDSLHYVYIIDHQKHLKGVISIKEIMNLSNSEHVENVMKKEIVFVRPHTHQESAAHLALAYDITAVPVLDKDEKFMGIIPSEAILRITSLELNEDIMLLEGIYSKDFADISTLNNSTMHLVKKRLPWLVIGLGGGLLAAQVIGYFESLLEREVLLMSFLPLMVYMSDAIGSQSQTIFIRYIALNSGVSFFKYLLKEFFVGGCMAIVLAALLTGIASVLFNPFLGFAIGVSLFCAILISVCVAILIPWMLIKLHKDPAVGSGPFATIIRDILSIVVYFSVSNVIYSF